MRVLVAVGWCCCGVRRASARPPWCASSSGWSAPMRRCCSAGATRWARRRRRGPLMDVAPALSIQFREALDAASTGPTSISGVFRSLLAELANGPRRLLVFEDVHWADEATMDLLRYLGLRVQDTPTLLV